VAELRLDSMLHSCAYLVRGGANDKLHAAPRVGENGCGHFHLLPRLVPSKDEFGQRVEGLEASACKAARMSEGVVVGRARVCVCVCVCIGGG
jgi:hypothetical protein